MYIQEKENFKTLAQNLKKQKILRINNFLNDEFVNRLRHCLLHEVDWGLACRIDNEPSTFLNCDNFKDLPKKIRKKFKKQINAPFQFIYGTYMMVTAYIEKRDPELFLNRYLEWLNTPDIIQYFKNLTQDNSIVKINAQATSYTAGQFLTQHNDEHIEEGRLYACVLGLTKNWNPDWGGLLHILNNKGKIVTTLVPEFNTLSIFKVPQDHFVSYVTPFAEEKRLSITGWLLSK